MTRTREIKKFLEEFGYKNQTEAAKALVEKGVYKNLETSKAYFNQVIHGERPANKKFLEGLEKISIDSNKFEGFVEEYKKENPKTKKYSLEKEADNLYDSFRTNLSNTENIYEKINMLLDFKNFTDKYSKNPKS